MFHRLLQAKSFLLPLLILLNCLVSSDVFSAEKSGSTFGITNFAFANYLGTGFYTTSGQNVFVLQVPLQHTIKEKTDYEDGWVLNLPLTFGFINFDSSIVDNIPELSDVATVTFIPGIEYQYPITPDWTIIPFVDYGFARDFNNKTNVLVIGSGIKSYYNYQYGKDTFTLGNEFLYAREKSKNSGGSSDYSLLKTGLNYRVTSDFLFNNEPLYSNLYYINFYYPNNLIFLERTDNPIRVGLEHEVGITFSNLPDFLFFERPQIGIGVRFGNDVNVYRIIFGAPF